jgi:predicted Zn-dependent peptidase
MTNPGTRAIEPRIYRDVLSNGLVVISEPMSQFRSVSVGIWVRTGSRRESAELNGICHFLEHMVFKGTERRSVEEIARGIDRIGGMLDAYTTKEMVSYNARVLDEHLPMAFDLLSDLLLRPLIAEEDIAREKQVVLEEIKMDEDNAEVLINELFVQNFWRGHALGRPILGTPETVPQFGQELLRDWHRRCYAPNNLVVVAAGNLEHERLLALVETEFGGLAAVPDGFAPTAPTPSSGIVLRHKRELEQVHICLGVASYSVTDPRRFTAALLNTILGAGMSSRLFQNIRERQGLAYAVVSETTPYRDAGLLSVYAATAREKVERLVQSVLEELHRVKEEGVSEEELRRAKDQAKGSLTLTLESTGAQMNNRARQEIYFGRFYDLDHIFAQIEEVTTEQIQQTARELFQPEKIAATVLGNLDGLKLTPEQLVC